MDELWWKRWPSGQALARKNHQGRSPMRQKFTGFTAFRKRAPHSDYPNQQHFSKLDFFGTRKTLKSICECIESNDKIFHYKIIIFALIDIAFITSGFYHIDRVNLKNL
jgi:hypothetical protein